MEDDTGAVVGGTRKRTERDPGRRPSLPTENVDVCAHSAQPTAVDARASLGRRDQETRPSRGPQAPWDTGSGVIL